MLVAASTLAVAALLKITRTRPGTPRWIRAISAGVQNAEKTTFQHPSWRLAGGLGYLGFDIAVLWICLTALGPGPSLPAVALAYNIGYIANALPIPGGIASAPARRPTGERRYRPAIGTSFLRTQQTIAVALSGRRVPVAIDPGLDEIRAGDLDGKPIEAYRSWVQHHARSERFPRGESLDDALIRYANALRCLLSRAEPITLLVIHEFALRHIAEAATVSGSLPEGNALPYLFDERAIEQAAAGLEKLAQADLAQHGAAVTVEPTDTVAGTFV